MKFIADLHVHSKYSRATAKNLDLENLYIAAQLKGVTVVGTGDFTYPAWFSELSEKLEPAEPGLFKLKQEYARYCDPEIPRACHQPVRFILSTEISNIYKKNEKTRKNHNLVLMPDLTVVEKLNAKLDKIGNIKSDGRPILGLDARNLLELLLETSDQGYLIPAHIWTPWFSMLGSKSGFDSVEECFEDLTPYIFAVETGLSSDPPMNWRVSGLDHLTLVSNSDAHSPMNIGREANLFDTELSFTDIKSALKTGDPQKFRGTFEFYPEEGKYHFDGHRNCGVRFEPQETIRHKGICPACGKGLMLGVLYRVEELADRPEDAPDSNRHPYYSIIQLADILSEILSVGSNSEKVQKQYYALLNQLGSEFDILHRLTVDKIETVGVPLLGEAIRKMRDGIIDVLPGYDGEYGKIKIFDVQEREQSIYGFRGSDITLFNRFKADYPGSGEIRLSRNYRSTETILNASFQIIRDHRIHSTDIRTYSEITGSKTISIIEQPDERAEADGIARIIETMIGGTGYHSIDTGAVKDASPDDPYSYSGFSVFYRTHDQHRILAEIFEKKGIPFQIASRQTALEQKGLSELISYLRIIEDQGSFFDFDRIRKLALPGIGKKPVDQFKNWCFQNRFSLRDGLSRIRRFPIPGMAAAKQQKLYEFSNHLSDFKTHFIGLSIADKLLLLKAKTGLFGKLNTDLKAREAFDRLLSHAGRFDGSMSEFLAALALHTDTDTYLADAEKVSLMTMHAAKGLEFPVVFIAGCEESLIPHRSPDREDNDIQEERRLFYVAMTRAMKKLYLTRAKKRRIHGRVFDRPLSRFVADIENQLKVDESPQRQNGKKDAPVPVQLELF